MEIIISLIATAAAFYLGAAILPGITIENFVKAIVIAIVIAVLNVTLGFLLKVLSLGILALLSWVLDAILILITGKLLSGFRVQNFWWALALAAIVSITSNILMNIF